MKNKGVFAELGTAGAKRADVAWRRAQTWLQEDRALPAFRKIVVEGASDVVLCRGQKARVVVASESADGLTNVRTHVEGQTLFVDTRSQTNSIHTQGTSIVQRTSGAGTIQIGSIGGVYRGQEDKRVPADASMVALVLPEIDSLVIEGAGDVAMYDLYQEALVIEIVGAGDVMAEGSAHRIEVNVSGAGNVDVEKLEAQYGEITVSGAGNVDARITQNARAAISGAGDVRIRGNPPQRHERVVGAGEVWFE